jgi:hypothetical protein
MLTISIAIIYSNEVQKSATLPPHLFPIHDANFSPINVGGASASGPRLHSFLETTMERLTLREALASDRLEAFVRQEEIHGVELATGSDLERALALLVTIRWSEKHNLGSKPKAPVNQH